MTALFWVANTSIDSILSEVAKVKSVQCKVNNERIIIILRDEKKSNEEKKE